MADVRNLDPDTRCLALVGMFLQRWAIMEGTIRELLATMLNLDIVSVATISSNMQLRDKIHTVRTLLDSYTVLTPSEKETYDDMCKDILEAAGKRNMLAHDLFYPADDGDGVAFFVIKAKGKFGVPTTVWTIAQFEIEFKQVDHFTESLEALTSLIEQRKPSRT
ncbi:MAG TPA: hypothetical protein VN823_00875 [Stellaceae bacterium]|nr:hypothetical protein [Stellaceae bacterium]